MFTIDDSLLRRMLVLNSYRMPQGKMIIVGLRACRPLNPNDHAFAASREVEPCALDYKIPRCTLVQWLPKDKQVAVFPGSTVPSLNNVKANAQTPGGLNCNRMLTGLYSDYMKGNHLEGKRNEHQALVQTKKHPCRRSVGDTIYELTDIVGTTVDDNIHCGYCDDGYTTFDSSGCQTLKGWPYSPHRPDMPANKGPWKVFHDNLYSNPAQKNYTYVLFEVSEVAQVAADADSPRAVTLQFGSYGDWVGKVQEALTARGFSTKGVDKDFGCNTIDALVAFQRQAFDNEATCIVEPKTAEQLGLELPLI